MGMGCSTRLLLIFGIVIIILLGTSLVLGRLGTDKPLFPEPKLHLSSQPLIPTAERDKALEHPEEYRLPPSRFLITNTILASWFTILFLVGFFYFATRRIREVPGRLQGMAESILELLIGLIEGAIGRERTRMVLPLVATIFLYVLFNALLAILPIFGPLGFFGEHGDVEIPLLRNASTDINVPLATALFAVLVVEYWGMRAIGSLRYLGQFFNVRDLLRGRPLGIINLFVGGLEALSHLIRIVSFTFRLFGNMTAGKTLVLIIAFLLPFLTFGFYGLEVLIGVIQALIFAGLTLVFATVAVTPHEDEAH